MNKKINFILYFLLIALILIAIATLIFYKSEGGKCINDPLTYAQDKIGNNSMCSCSDYSSGLPNYYCARKCPSLNEFREN